MHARSDAISLIARACAIEGRSEVREGKKEGNGRQAAKGEQEGHYWVEDP